MTKGITRLPIDLRVPQAPPVIPAFERGDWVRLIWHGYTVTGKVVEDLTFREGGSRIVSFETETGIQYTVPPELLEQVLSPVQEGIAQVILGEDLLTIHGLELPFSIEDARAIVRKIVNALREEAEHDKRDPDKGPG